MMASPKRLATIKEACAYGKLGRTKLYAKIANGEVLAYRREGRTLVDLASIDEMNDRLLRPWTARRDEQRPCRRARRATLP